MNADSVNGHTAGLLDRLEGVRKSGAGWLARCPAHEDRSPSLKVDVGSDGRTLVRCHGGCKPAAIAEAVGLKLADLFAPREAGPSKPRIVAQYPYRDEASRLLYEVVRLDPKSFRQRRPDGSGYAWSLGDVKRVLYRLPELLAADPSAPAFVVEGEKDADALAALGLIATTNAGGAGKWRSEYGHALAGRDVVILPDNDDVGRTHSTAVATSLQGIARSVKVIALRGLPAKGDVSDWLAAGGTPDVLRAIASDAPPWAPEATPPPSDAAPSPEPRTFDHDLELALSDVQTRLGAQRATDRQPLFFDAAELFKRDYPATPWLVTGLVSRGGVAIIGAEPKSAKTWAAVEIALAVATGTPVCGEFHAERGVAAYFFAEDLDVQVRNRVRALLAGRDLRPDSLTNLHVCPRGQFLDLTCDDDLAWIVASCRRIGKIDLLVLDPLRDLHSGEEDKSDSMRNVMRRLRLLAELLSCTVVVSHHSAKQSADSGKRRPGQRMRGSGAIHGSTDSGIYLGVRGGDGVARFELDVDSEIKGARSAGHFELALVVEDDDSGSAIKATWAVSRPEHKRGTGAQDADDAAMFDLVRELAIRGQHLSRRALRDHDECSISDRRARAAFDRLIDSGRLELRGPAVHLPAARESER